MRSNRDITSSIILIVIIFVIFALVYYLFFYPGSRPQSPTQGQKVDQDISLSTPEALYKEEKGNEEASPKKAEKPPLDTDSAKKIGKRDRQPTPKKAEKPSIDRDNNTQENTQALDQIRADMDNLIAFVNQRSLQQFLQEMISGFEIREGGNKLTIYVANTWYYLPPVQKQVMFNLIALRYARQTCALNVRSECSKDDFPTISFLNPENREVARMAAHQPLQIFE